jgi:hypothetical protein
MASLSSSASGAHGSVVGTGLLPIKVRVIGGTATYLRPGEIGIVSTGVPVHREGRPAAVSLS